MNNNENRLNHVIILDNIDIEGARLCSEISHTRTDQTV